MLITFSFSKNLSGPCSTSDREEQVKLLGGLLVSVVNFAEILSL